MKLVKQIAETLGRGDADWLTLVINREELETAIAAKLEPVRKLLKSIKSDVMCEGVSPVKRGWDEYDKECSPRMALNAIGAKAVEALALLSEEAAVKTKKFRISSNLIIDILRGLNKDMGIRIEGIPDDAKVVDVSFTGRELVLHVSTDAEIEGDELHVVVHKGA